MTLDLARRVSAHAAMASAFAAMAVSGVVPAWATAAFAGSLVAGWLLNGRYPRWLGPLLTSAAGAALLVLAALTAAIRLDLVVSASGFAAVLAGNRVVLRRSAADDGFMYLSALLMLAGGAALSADVFYAVCFAGFGISVTVALTLSLLARTAEGAAGGADFVRGPAAVARPGTVAAFGLLTLAGAALVFALFPRINFGFFRPRASLRGPHLSGFTETVRLGGHGSIRSDTRVMLRARFAGEGGRRPHTGDLDLLWAGRSYERYDGAAWRKATTAKRAGATVRFPEAGEADARVQVEVLPAAEARAVFAPGRLVEATLVRTPSDRLRPGWWGRALERDAAGDVQLSLRPDDAFRYDARVRLAGPAPVAGRGQDYPEQVRSLYLQLPALDDRVTRLAASLAPADADPADVVVAVMNYLRRFRYTTVLPGEQRDPLAHFLFERKAGHCEYFSTAMAVLLRARGIPARNVTGFAGGRYVAAGGYHVLLGGDAHSWVEAYFPGAGFVPFDPTPAAAREAAPEGLSVWLAELVDALQSRWNDAVVDYSYLDQLRGAQAAFRALSAMRDRVAAAGLRGKLGSARPPLAVAVLLASLVLAWRLWISEGPRGPVSEVTRLYRRMLRRLARKGYQKGASMTAEEFCRVLAQRKHPAAAEVEAATAAYLARRFGGHALTPAAREQMLRAAR